VWVLVLQSVGNGKRKIAKSNKSELWSYLSYRGVLYIFEVNSSFFRFNFERPLISMTSKGQSENLENYLGKISFLPLMSFFLIWLDKKNQNGRVKKTEFFIAANSQYFFAKTSVIGSWVSKIN
jgi:hypothetical protein